MTTFTATIRLTEPVVGGDTGTWGGEINNDLVYIDEAINQTVNVAMADSNISLLADGSTGDQARYHRYNFTGALTADRTITLPANQKIGYVTNSTTGGHNIILSAGGTTLTVPTTAGWMLFAVDGSNNVTSPTVGHGSVAIPIGGKVISTTGNGAVTFTSNGVVLNLSNSGTAIFDFSDSSQAFAWGYGVTTPMVLAGATGNLTITGAYSSSDRRVKENIETITPQRGTEWLTASRPVEYIIKGSATAGFIAQEQISAGFQRGIALTDDPAMRETSDSPEGKRYTLDTSSRIAYLTAAVQHLLARIETLESAR